MNCGVTLLNNTSSGGSSIISIVFQGENHCLREEENFSKLFFYHSLQNSLEIILETILLRNSLETNIHHHKEISSLINECTIFLL